jgi:hypothetical protein
MFLSEVNEPEIGIANNSLQHLAFLQNLKMQNMHFPETTRFIKTHECAEGVALPFAFTFDISLERKQQTYYRKTVNRENNRNGANLQIKSVNEEGDAAFWVKNTFHIRSLFSIPKQFTPL